MEKGNEYSLDQAHLHFAIDFNKRVFALADKSTLNAEEALEIVNAAHASLLHWEKYSKYKKANTQRGLYMIAKAYVAIKDGNNAMHFALLCIDITERYSQEMQDFDLFYANEMMARVAALNKDKELFEKHYTTAKKQLIRIQDKEDLKWATKDFESGDWFGMR